MATTRVRISESQFQALVQGRSLPLPECDLTLVLDDTLGFDQLVRAIHHAMPIEHVSLADRCIELTTDRERLLYWLLRLLQSARTTAVLGALQCLDDFDCAPASDRARQLLRLGEPGGHNHDT